MVFCYILGGSVKARHKEYKIVSVPVALFSRVPTNTTISLHYRDRVSENAEETVILIFNAIALSENSMYYNSFSGYTASACGLHFFS